MHGFIKPRKSFKLITGNKARKTPEKLTSTL
jgi:hypothetical protein